MYDQTKVKLTIFATGKQALKLLTLELRADTSSEMTSTTGTLEETY